MKKKAFDKEFAEEDFLYGDTEKTLNDAIKLCKASIKTNNPIEFYW